MTAVASTLERSLHFSPCISSEKGIFAAKLGTRLSTAKSRSCAACRLFYSVRVCPGTETDQREYHFRAYSSLRNNYCISFPGLKKAMRQRWMNYDGVCLAVVPGKQEPTIDVDDVKKHCWTKGYVARTFDTKSSPNSFHGMVIPGLLDFSICSRWIDFCKKHHSLQNCGRGSDINAVAELKLIDCSTDDHCFKIVSGSLTQTYAALSYVWGNHKPVIAWDKGHPNSGANILQAKSLPKVIYDAIIATKKLKLQFLWVDQYCIDQDNEKEK